MRYDGHDLGRNITLVGGTPGDAATLREYPSDMSLHRSVGARFVPGETALRSAISGAPLRNGALEYFVIDTTSVSGDALELALELFDTIDNPGGILLIGGMYSLIPNHGREVIAEIADVPGAVAVLKAKEKGVSSPTYIAPSTEPTLEDEVESAVLPRDVQGALCKMMASFKET